MKAGILIGLLALLVALGCGHDDVCADCAGMVGTAETGGTSVDLEPTGGTSSGGAPSAP
jgi:hypothetical protein